jgi:nucleotide-binding universal stress UspA family protein
MSKHLFPPNKILVPTDLGPASAAAMGFARVIHERFATPVEVIHAFHLDLPPYFSSGQIDALKREINKARHSAEELIRKENAARLGFETGIVIVNKPPLDAVLEESERLRADLIIMGTHGRQGAKRLMLGSVAERVLRQSRIPVLAVRESAKPGRFRHILCPFNFSPVGKAALDYAAGVAEADEALLTIMHAQESGGGLPACELVEEPIRKRCKVEEVLIGGEAAKGILEAVQRVKPDLIIMGAEQKSTMIGELFSSTTERVMQLAGAPLLVVPTR